MILTGKIRLFVIFYILDIVLLCKPYETFPLLDAIRLLDSFSSFERDKEKRCTILLAIDVVRLGVVSQYVCILGLSYYTHGRIRCKVSIDTNTNELPVPWAASNPYAVEAD